MYATHRLRLNIICLGMVIAVSVLLALLVVMQINAALLSGTTLIIGHVIGAILPILAYVILIDATEDCFDCFNRSKD